MNTLGELIIGLLVIAVANWLLYTLVKTVVKITVDIAYKKIASHYEKQIKALKREIVELENQLNNK